MLEDFKCSNACPLLLCYRLFGWLGYPVSTSVNDTTKLKHVFCYKHDVLSFVVWIVEFSLLETPKEAVDDPLPKYLMFLCGFLLWKCNQVLEGG